jgi:alkane 1-monooxygenase
MGLRQAVFGDGAGRQQEEVTAAYTTMITAAYLLPLWFAWMDPRVMAHFGGDLGLVNLQASARAKLAQRWA